MRATKPIKLTSEGLYVNSTALIFLPFHRFRGPDFSARWSTCAVRDCCKKLQLVLDFSVKKARQSTKREIEISGLSIGIRTWQTRPTVRNTVAESESGRWCRCRVPTSPRRWSTSWRRISRRCKACGTFEVRTLLRVGTTAAGRMQRPRKT